MIGILAIDPRTGVISTQVRKPLFPAASLDDSYIESQLRKVVMERQKLRESLSWPESWGFSNAKRCCCLAQLGRWNPRTPIVAEFELQPPATLRVQGYAKLPIRNVAPPMVEARVDVQGAPQNSPRWRT